MPKVVDGSIVCRISYAPDHTGKKFYCDHCGGLFDDREYLPCDSVAVLENSKDAYQGELFDSFEIAGVVSLQSTNKVVTKKKK